MPQIHYHTTNYSLAYPEEGRLGGSNPIESSDFLNCVCKIYCPTPRSAPILIKSYILYRKTLKIVSKFQNLLQLLGTSFPRAPRPPPYYVNPSTVKFWVRLCNNRPQRIRFVATYRFRFISFSILRHATLSYITTRS